MNPVCFICSSTATLACSHPECTLPPFLCSGPYNDEQSRINHTHNHTRDFVPIKEFFDQINQIRIKAEPEALHKEYLDGVKKRAIILKDHLIKMINGIDEMVQRHQNDLKINLKLRLAKRSNNILNRLEQDMNGRALVGKDIDFVMIRESTFQGERQITKAMKSMKRRCDEQFNQLEKIKINTNLMYYQQTLDRSKQLFIEGQNLRNEKRFEEALMKFQQAERINDFDNRIYFKIAYCQNKLNRLEESESSYLKCLQLYPQSHDALNNIGTINCRKNNKQKAIQWYSKAIQINPTYPNRFSNRGSCFLKLNRLKEAIQDYMSANKLKPCKEYADRIEQIENKMKEINPK